MNISLQGTFTLSANGSLGVELNLPSYSTAGLATSIQPNRQTILKCPCSACIQMLLLAALSGNSIQTGLSTWMVRTPDLQDWKVPIATRL